jgi:eukaryotic-like serine/threonine-protein kinase
MDWRRVARRVAWVLGLGTLVLFVGATSFCLALRSDRRSEVVEVPDWTGRTQDDAAAEAGALGLAFEVGDQRHDAAVSAGRIIMQEPAPGTNVRRGRSIRVVVSTGGETLTVPSLVGQPSRQADLEIRRQGLASGWESHIHDASTQAGRVLDQAPAAGVLATSGERVDRLVGDGARDPRWVMPDLTGRPLRVAQEWITLCGLRSGAVRRARAADSPAGTVIGQRPRAGWPVTKSDIVELTIAD